MAKTFYNDAVIGNSKTLACITRTGKLVRLFWPHIDYFQSINTFSCGVFLRNPNIDNVLWLHDREWVHKQYYIGDTNILKTVCENIELGIRVTQIDYVVPEQDVVIRSYEIENIGNIKRNVEFFIFSSLLSTTQDMRNSFFDFSTDALIQYGHEYYLGVAGDDNISQFQIGNDAFSSANTAYLVGHNDIGMCPEAAVAWNLGEFCPNDKKQFNIYICLGNSLGAVREVISIARNVGATQYLTQTEEYWAQVINDAYHIETQNSDMNRVYKRSVLMLKLMHDKETGGILAAPEIDEEFSRCGRYGYCWCRDAVYVAVALDRCGLIHEAEKFYEWTAKVQEPNGSWLQRYHIDGNLAPSWGLQIDQVGTVLWGILSHYKVTGEIEFLKNMWDCVRKGADFLIGFIDGDTGLARQSYDLWEERFGEHAYSTAAVYGGLRAACEISELVDEDHEQRIQWEQACETIKLAIGDVLWDEKLGRFVRSVRVKLNPWGSEPSSNVCVITVNPKGYQREVSLVDCVVDISLLGLCIPFGVFPVCDPKIRATVESIERVLTTSGAGGIRRYENDSYIGGNPWPVVTLWMAIYYIQIEDYEKAMKYLEWTVNNRTELDLLPEQVDKENGGPAWVIPLTASHAMFILVFKSLSKVNKI